MRLLILPAVVATLMGNAVPDIPAPFAQIGLKAGMPYAAARQKLVRAGYRPARLSNDACSSAGGKRCATYREIEACAGTGAGFCSARFIARGGEIYAVVTAGAAGPLVRVFANPDMM